MLRKTIALILVFCFAFTLTSCGAPEPNDDTAVSTEGAAEGLGDFKIGIMTSSVSQGEESYRAGAALAAQYPDNVIHVTYPDNFTTEQEQTISTMLSMAADPDVKAIVTAESVVGTAAAFAKVKEIRPDILLIAGQATDDPTVITEVMDLGICTDMPGFAEQLSQAAADMGAKRIVYYTFPRHIARVTTAQQVELFEEIAPQKGLEFIMVTTPDPLSDAGLAGTQQFVLEDVKRAVEQYGADTAFYSTNIGQSEPIIKSVLETKSYYLTPPEPSPFTGFPGAMGIAIPEDKRGDVDYIMGEIESNLASNDMSGHMGLWTVPALTFFINSGFKYAVEYCQGTITEKVDEAALSRIMAELAGGEVSLRKYPMEDGSFLENYYFCLAPYYILGGAQ
ncbi:MAG: DUF3798 domain-containing protein [Clostridiales bacterium]|jgi:hypothetical protein|nr:DUF3798 domain-containing protein [Clostridiales bacterium]